MNAVDLTPTFALRKLAVLFDGGKVGECAALVRRLTAITLESILGQLPVDILHDAMPSSLPVLEAIYVKVSQTHPGQLPTDILRTDQLVQRMVALFAKQPPAGSNVVSYQNEGSGGEEKNCNVHVPCCRSIVRVIMENEPSFTRNVAQRKRALDRCLRRMGQHGLVSGPDGKLLSLHEALRVEFDRQAVQFKAAVHKMEQLQLVQPGKHHHGPHLHHHDKPGQLAEVSHQRLLQLSRGDVQERVIKNKTLLNCVEPEGSSQALHRLLHVLRARVEADKLLLFHDTELRKMAAHTSRARLTAMAEPPGQSGPGSWSSSGSYSGQGDGGKSSSAAQTHQLAATIQQFSQGYAAILRLAKEVAEAQGDVSAEDVDDELSDSSDEDEQWDGEGVRSPRREEGDGDCHLSVTSTLSIMNKMKVVSLNGILPSGVYPPHYHHHPAAAALAGLSHTSSSAGRIRNGWLDVGSALPPTPKPRSRGQLTRREAGTQTATTMMEKETEDHNLHTSNGHGGSQPLQHTPSAHRNRDVRDSDAVDDGARPTPAPRAGPGAGGVAMLEQEVLYLRHELSSAREQMRKLQEQERQLRERLHGQTHQQFQMGNDQFEDVSLGSDRPAELIRRYGELYSDGRVEALDALDRLGPLKGLDVLKLKILFSVVVLSFKCTQQNVGELRGKLRHLLGLPVPGAQNNRTFSQLPPPSSSRSGHGGDGEDHPHQLLSPHNAAAAEMEHHITSYLCKTAGTYEVSEIVFEVCQQIYATLYDYPCLKACAGLLEYTSQCVRIAWGLGVQRCPYTINYDAQTFDEGFHLRFHTSDPDSAEVASYLWPALVDAQGTCVSRAVVIT